MLGEIFQRFVEKSPIVVMVRGVLERVLGAEALDAWYERTAQKQYTQTLLFSTLYELMSAVVFAIKPSVHAAYQGREAEVGTSIGSVYSKLKGIELQTSAELVRYSATALAPIVEQVGGAREPWLAGYQVKIIDGNCLEATEHRLKPLRELGAGALPGKSLVVFDPVLGLVTEVFPCEDGHAQERALLGEVLPTIKAGELWLHDRNFCTRDFLCGHLVRGAFFISRQHQQLPLEALGELRPAGRVETGKVAEQRVRVCDSAGNGYTFRRIRLELDEPTRDGEQVIYLLTNLPRQLASAKTIARLYGKRWTIERAFQDLEGQLHSEQYPGLSAGGAVWLLCRVGRLQRAGGGVCRLAGGAWGADHRPPGLRLLPRQRNRRNASWNDDRHSRRILAGLCNDVRSGVCRDLVATGSQGALTDLS
jgi:hypothetical protein